LFKNAPKGFSVRFSFSIAAVFPENQQFLSFFHKSNKILPFEKFFM